MRAAVEQELRDEVRSTGTTARQLRATKARRAALSIAALCVVVAACFGRWPSMDRVEHLLDRTRRGRPCPDGRLSPGEQVHDLLWRHSRGQSQRTCRYLGEELEYLLAESQTGGEIPLPAEQRAQHLARELRRCEPSSRCGRHHDVVREMAEVLDAR